MATRIQNRRDTAANWTTNNPTLADGEIGFETDTGLFKIGANDTAWTSLAYAQVAGPAGPEGAVGPVGEVGAVGEPGLPGLNGLDGLNGLSAYEIWLNLGNSGSEQDFIDSLAGEDGVAGVDGVDGVDGQDGAPGADGQDGAPGAGGGAGLGYKVRAQIDDSVSTGSGFSSWIFEEYSAYQNGNRIRIFSEGGDFQEGTISDLSNGLNFQLNIESSNGTLGSGYYPVTIVGNPGLTGGEGIQGPGYLATGLISNNLNVSTIGIDGNSSQTVNFTGDKIAYQAGDRVKVAQVSNPSNYIGGVVNAVIYGPPIASGIAPNVTYSFPTSVNVVIDSKGGSGTWTANSTQLSISLAGEKGPAGAGSDLSSYLTQASASTTYLTQASASATYATIGSGGESSGSAGLIAHLAADNLPNTINTISRVVANSSLTINSGTLYLSHFTPQVNLTVGRISMQPINYPSSNPTYAKLCIYSIASDNVTMTLIGSTADLGGTHFFRGNSIETKLLTSSVNLVAGQRYAAGFLTVGATGTGSLKAATNGQNGSGMIDLFPVISTQWTSQSVLPDSLTIPTGYSPVKFLSSPWFYLAP